MDLTETAPLLASRIFDALSTRLSDRIGRAVGPDPARAAAQGGELAIAAGANVKAVQRMLGHASAAMTLDVYAGLFGDDLDVVATNLRGRGALQAGRAGEGTRRGER